MISENKPYILNLYIRDISLQFWEIKTVCVFLSVSEGFFVYMSVGLFVCGSFVYLCVFLSVSVRLFVCGLVVSVCGSFCLSVDVWLCLWVFLSVYCRTVCLCFSFVSVCGSFCLSVDVWPCLWVFLSVYLGLFVCGSFCQCLWVFLSVSVNIFVSMGHIVWAWGKNSQVSNYYCGGGINLFPVRTKYLKFNTILKNDLVFNNLHEKDIKFTSDKTTLKPPAPIRLTDLI